MSLFTAILSVLICESILNFSLLSDLTLCMCSVGMDTAASCFQCRPSRLRWPGNCYTVPWRHSVCVTHRLHFSHGGKWISVWLLNAVFYWLWIL